MKLEPSSQASILTRRYWACTLGDPITLLLLVAQAPFIGWLCTLVWASVEEDTPSLRFVLCLASVWFGAINACREIVKERPILERERFFGLSMLAYVRSKVQVLSMIGLCQVLLLQLAVEWKIGIIGAFPVQSLALFSASLCGTMLGLLASALARTQERAVGAIPLLILPQILFSEFSIPESAFSELVSWVQRLMPVHWAYQVFKELAEEGNILPILKALCMEAILAGGILVMVWLALLKRREE
jgi:ABC-type multidrug transport system permease subunit